MNREMCFKVYTSEDGPVVGDEVYVTNVGYGKILQVSADKVECLVEYESQNLQTCAWFAIDRVLRGVNPTTELERLRLDFDLVVKSYQKHLDNFDEVISRLNRLESALLNPYEH